MNLRTKLIVVFAALAFLPLIAVSVIGYRSGVGAVDSLLRERTDERAVRMARNVEHVISVQESRLLELSKTNLLREYVGRVRRAPDAVGAGGVQSAGTAQDVSAIRSESAARSTDAAQSTTGAASATGREVPEAVIARFNTYTEDNREYLQAVACLDSSGRPLFRMKRSDSGQGFILQTANFVSGQVRYDEGVWSHDAAKAWRSPVSEDPSYGATLRITVPVVESTIGADDTSPAGALVAEFRLSNVVKGADQTEAPESSADAEGRDAATTQPASRSVVALDNATDMVVYHTNGALNHQPASTVMPYFTSVAARMKAGEEGFDFYDTQDGEHRLAAFRQAGGLNLSLAASEDYTATVGPVRRSALFTGGLGLAAGLTALALLFVTAGREMHDIKTVARGASAIAAGNLDQRIDVSATGETRELAESFNLMSDRLRELIAREAESRQFQSFLRISAMISHDLKNAIAGLSMLVSNMERQFHREEFRADAIESLREATEKLKRTVARLSEPAKSLSGEYRMAARATDLIPVIRRVLATNAEPSRPLYDIEARLPERLVATVEPERVENVVENLVINALEAMGAKGGRLTVEAGKLDGDLVFFSVSDTGIGMSDEFVKTRLFRPFATTKNKGIGLGLFTCREIVEAHGGRLDVESRVGAGTRFRVVLPSRLFNSGERRAQPVKATAAMRSAVPGSSE
jgi:signal transduction histidine kinase